MQQIEPIRQRNTSKDTFHAPSSSFVPALMNSTTNNTDGLTTAHPFPFHNEATIALLFLSIYLSEQFFGKTLQTSPLLGQLLAGVVLGPACFNIIPFAPAFRFMGKIGVMLLVLESGLATDMKQVVKHGTRAFFAALSGTLSPVLLAIVGGVLLFNASATVGLAAGSAIAPTSLGFSAKLLGTEGLKTNLGSIIAISAVIDDVLSLCLLEIVRALGNATTMWDYVKPVVASLGSIVGGVLVVWVIQRCKIIARIVQCTNTACVKKTSTVTTAPVTPDRVYLCLLLFVSVFLGWSCASVGSSDLLGVFLSGVAFSESTATKAAFDKHFAKLTKIGTSMFFACTVGFGVPSLIGGDGLFSGPALARGVMLLFAALIGKAIPLGFFATPLTTINFFKFAIAMQVSYNNSINNGENSRH